MSQAGNVSLTRVRPAAAPKRSVRSAGHGANKNISDENQGYLESARNNDLKFIFITGGVISSLGKGVAGAALGCLLKSMGYTVSMQKLDPYLNTDAGTMNPLQHGEVYVTDDGSETDMDLGHYERFLDVHLPPNSCFTSGYVYSSVFEREREGTEGEYRGKTIQIVPHVTDMIKHMILRKIQSRAQIIMVEIGGTVGDIEGLPFLEAVQELRGDLPARNTLSIHLTFLPYLKSSGETKTKPTQHSVKELRAAGLRPDIIVCRSDEEVTEDTRRKIARTCGLRFDCVFESRHLEHVYMLPEHLADQGLPEKVCEILNLSSEPIDIAPMMEFTRGLRELNDSVRIAVVGKYVDQEQSKAPAATGRRNTYYESYKSVTEALTHAGVRLGRSVDIVHLEADDLAGPGAMERELGRCDGILVPGGFGERGTELMMEAIGTARTGGKPFFGICFGLHLAIVEYARNVLGRAGATSEELRSRDEPDAQDFIYFMESWFSYRTAHLIRRERDDDIGGTMRLGLQPCFLNPGTRAFSAYHEIHKEARRRGWETRRTEAYVYKAPPLTEAHECFSSAFSLELDPVDLDDLSERAARAGRMTVYERHRHRYEINPVFHEALTAETGGDRFVISGEAPDMPGRELDAAPDIPKIMPPRIVEIMELERHPWFLGCQFHPEFLSRPLKPHPLFHGFVKAAIGYKAGR
jgi:CTP synthase